MFVFSRFVVAFLQFHDTPERCSGSGRGGRFLFLGNPLVPNSEVVRTLNRHTLALLSLCLTPSDIFSVALVSR
jgi:hypothetical protein